MGVRASSLRERSEWDAGEPPLRTPSSPDRSRLFPLALDYTRLSRPEPNREPVRRLQKSLVRLRIRKHETDRAPANLPIWYTNQELPGAHHTWAPAHTENINFLSVLSGVSIHRAVWNRPKKEPRRYIFTARTKLVLNWKIPENSSLLG